MAWGALENFKMFILRDFLSKVFNVWAKKIQRNYVMTLKSDAIFKEKPTGCLKNDTTNLVSFHASFWKSENVHCHGLLLPMVNKLSTKKVQMSYLSWHWRVI